MPAEAEALVAELRARGVELRAVGDRLRYKPASALTPADVEVLRKHKAAVLALLRPAPPFRDQIAEYSTTLCQLWALGAQGAEADPAEIRRLLDAQARQCDELGPMFAEAVSRHAAREWAVRVQCCPFCGLEGVFHDPDTGEAIALDLAAIVAFTAGPDAAAVSPVPVDTSDWPDALPGLGARTVGPLSRCASCGVGTWASYGDVSLCQACARRGGPGR